MTPFLLASLTSTSCTFFVVHRTSPPKRTVKDGSSGKPISSILALSRLFSTNYQPALNSTQPFPNNYPIWISTFKGETHLFQVSTFSFVEPSSVDQPSSPEETFSELERKIQGPESSPPLRASRKILFWFSWIFWNQSSNSVLSSGENQKIQNLEHLQYRPCMIFRIYPFYLVQWV